MITPCINISHVIKYILVSAEISEWITIKWTDQSESMKSQEVLVTDHVLNIFLSLVRYLITGR
jgi:hypothetical protein